MSLSFNYLLVVILMLTATGLVTDTVPFACSILPFVLVAFTNHLYLLILTLPTSSYFNYFLVVIIQMT